MGQSASYSSSLPSQFPKLLSPLPQSYIQLQPQSQPQQSQSSSSCPCPKPSPSASGPQILQHPSLPSLRPYLILLNSTTPQKKDFIDSITLRSQHPQLLMQIPYGQLIQDSKQYVKIKVYMEYIVFNLQQFVNLHFYDLMAIFYRVFKGFQVMYQAFGSFAPDPRMIGFNQEAEVRVWAHYKYSKSKPKIAYQMFDQQKMVEALIEIFSSKVDISTLPIDSHRRRFNLSAKTFDDAIKIIQGQVESVQLIPKYIKSIANLINSGRKFKQGQIISMNSEFYSRQLDKTLKFNYSNPNSLPQRKSKPNINFSFGGQSVTPKRQASSLPKINFTSSTTPKKQSKVKFTLSNPSNSANPFNSSQVSRLSLSNSISPQTSTIKYTPNHNPNPAITINTNPNASTSTNGNENASSAIVYSPYASSNNNSRININFNYQNQTEHKNKGNQMIIDIREVHNVEENQMYRTVSNSKPGKKRSTSLVKFSYH